MCPSKFKVFMWCKVWKYVLQLMNKEHTIFVCVLFVAFVSHRNANPGVTFRKKICTWVILNSALLLAFGVAEQGTVCLKSPDNKMGEEEGEKAALQHE